MSAGVDQSATSAPALFAFAFADAVKHRAYDVGRDAELRLVKPFENRARGRDQTLAARHPDHGGGTRHTNTGLKGKGAAHPFIHEHQGGFIVAEGHPDTGCFAFIQFG